MAPPKKKLLSFKTPIHDSHEQNTVFHFSSIRCQTSMLQLYVSLNNENQSLLGRGKFSQNFALNSPPKNKCRFAISHEQNNSFHLNLTSCKHRHRYYSGIISNNCEFLLKAYAWSPTVLEFRMISRVTNQRLAVSSWLPLVSSPDSNINLIMIFERSSDFNIQIINSLLHSWND